MSELNNHTGHKAQELYLKRINSSLSVVNLQINSSASETDMTNFPAIALNEFQWRALITSRAVWSAVSHSVYDVSEKNQLFKQMLMLAAYST